MHWTPLAISIGYHEVVKDCVEKIHISAMSRLSERDENRRVVEMLKIAKTRLVARAVVCWQRHHPLEIDILMSRKRQFQCRSYDGQLNAATYCLFNT